MKYRLQLDLSKQLEEVSQIMIRIERIVTSCLHSPDRDAINHFRLRNQNHLSAEEQHGFSDRGMRSDLYDCIES